ncbi:MAG: hypothetical protein AAFV07_09185, partial [Bacteroidota bacterium]
MEKRFILFWLCLIPVSLMGQDQMHLTDGRVLDVRITQIDQLYLFYFMSHKPDGPEYSIPKLQVDRLVYEDGTIEKMQESAPVGIQTPAEPVATQRTRSAPPVSLPPSPAKN